MDLSNSSSELIFYVNCRRVVRTNPNPRMMLAEFLRVDLKLTGTKVACGEGGCGSCTVLLSKYDRSSSTIRHGSANACLTPICALHGLSVTTIEALGNTNTKLHLIQERLVKSHGIQCGFCTPGMVMSMYALLRNNPKPSKWQIEHAIKGNLCRCTGYRPILDAFSSFADKASTCLMGDKCCQKSAGQTENCGGGCKTCECFCDETQELIFPSELQLSDGLDCKSLMFGSESDVLWLRPTSLAELFALRKRFPDARLAAGCTAVAFSLKSYLVTKPIVIINTSNISELTGFQQTDNYIFFGALTTVAQSEKLLQDIVQKLPDSKTRVAAALLDMFRMFASPQMRNSATIGGNLALASASSDINVILLTCDSKVKLASADGGREMLISQFIKTKGQTSLQSNEVIVGIQIPLTTQDEYFGSFKQSPRRDLTMADVNGAMSVTFEAGNDVVKCVKLAVGGTAAIGTQLVDVNKHLVGRKWDRTLLEVVMSDILVELDSIDNVVDNKIYRHAAVQGFLFRFHLQVYEQLCQKLKISAFADSDRMYLDTFSQRNCSSCHTGMQVFQQPKRESDTDTVGQPLPNQWSKQCTTGEAVFIDDMKPTEGELYVVLVGSAKANARVRNVDPSKALQIHGVVGYIDHTSVASNLTGVAENAELFATKEVHWIGQTIGAVVADSHEVAQCAAKAVEVNYEELKPIITIEDAVAHNSFHAFPPNQGRYVRGDTESALQSADHVIEGEVRIGGQEHFYMETQRARAVPSGEDGELDVYVGAQLVSVLQGLLARVLNVMSNKISIHVKRMGGAFGGKATGDVLLTTLPAAIAAKRFNRPTRCVLDRRTDMQITGSRRENLAKYKVGFDKAGKVLAVDLKLYSNDGFLDGFSTSMMGNTIFNIDNCYAIPNISFQGYSCKTNLPNMSPMRGAGAPQGTFLCEYMLRQVAHYLKVPAVQIQHANLYQPGELTVGNIPIEASLHQCFKDVQKQSNLEKMQQEIAEFNKKNKYLKRGIDIIPVRFNPFIFRCWAQAGALVHIYADGSVLLSHGGVESGQGLHTKTIQIASRALNAPVEFIHLREMSTEHVPNSTATGGSSGSDLYGMATKNACEILAERLKPYRIQNPSATWQELITSALGDRVCLSAAGYFKCPHSTDFDWEKHTGSHGIYYTYGVGVTQVEIDCLSGNYMVLKVDIVMDVGKSLNPAIDVGQIEGGFVMGLGYHALEEHRYGPDGRLETSGAGKYYIPSVNSIPLEMNVTLLKNSNCPIQSVYSSKGIGEPPLQLSSSVFFAIQNAIIAARSDAGLPSQFTLDSPVTVSKILLACTKP